MSFLLYPFRLLGRFVAWLTAPEPTDCPDCLAVRRTHPYANCGDCTLDTF